MTLTTTIHVTFDIAKNNLIIFNLCAILIFSTYLIIIYIRLNHVSDLFLIAFTNIVRLRWILTRKTQYIHINLHRKYESLVNIDFNTVFVENLAQIQQIYYLIENYVKSNFYSILQSHVKNATMLEFFNTQNENLHRILKKSIVDIYSMSNLINFESYVNSII